MSKKRDSQLYRTNRSILKREVQQTGRPCEYCLSPIDLSAPMGTPLAFTADHVIPVSAGGSDRLDNLVPAHFKCNVAKGNKVAVQVPKKVSKATRHWW